jgi:hydroxymethylpyrimidine pyrophosphatase-like HAD family hydrolase
MTTAPVVRALLACDLDGTLLDAWGEPATGVGEVLPELAAGGVALVIVTGRPLQSARRATDLLGAAPLAYACYHGALVVDAATGAWLRHLAVDLAATRAVAVEALRRGLGVTAWERDEPRELVSGEVASLACVTRLVLHGEPAAVDGLATDLAGEWAGRLRIEPIRPGYAGVFHPGADKGDALRLLVARLEPPRGAVIACGDSSADATLLAAADVRIVVGDAPGLLSGLPDVVRTSLPGLAATLRSVVAPLL